MPETCNRIHPVIGMISPRLGDEFFGNLAFGSQRVALEAGGQVIGLQTPSQWQDTPSLPVAGAAVSFGHELVDAFIVVLDAVSAHELQHLGRSRKPIVTVCADHVDLGIPAVFPDNRAGITEMVRHLVQHGHVRIGFAGCMKFADTLERHAAYEAALRDAGLEPDPRLIFHATDMDQPGGEAAAAELLAAGMPCTALCVATDQNAISLVDAIRRDGYAVPRDLAVTAFDDLDICALVAPSLTTVQQDNAEIGAAAARLVLAMLEGEAVQVRRYYVPTVPVFRQSCGCWVSKGAEATELTATSSPESWATNLGDAMVRAALQGTSTSSDRDAARLRDGIDRCIAVLDAVLGGSVQPPPGAMAGALRAICVAANSVETVNRAFGVFQREAAGRASQTKDAVLASRVADLIDDLRAELIYAVRLPYVKSFVEAQDSARSNYHSTLALLEPQYGSPRDLAWLCQTPVLAGYLGLWRDDVPGSALTVVGGYQRRATARTQLGEVQRPEAFPALEMFGVIPDDPSTMIMVIPVHTAEHDWGALAVLCEIERQSTLDASAVRQWSVLLAAALERERLQSVQVAAREAAERLAQTHTEFLASISHELRTPLTIMLGYSDLLLARWDALAENTRRDYVRRVVASATRQQRLVEDLLLVSKVEANALDVRRELVDIPVLIAQAADDLQVAYAGQTVTAHGPDDLHVIGDSMRLGQIITNLLDNAAKYSEEGSPVEVTWSREGTMVVVRVRDRGRGVPQSGREHLFSRFGRMPGSKIRGGRVGTGLGLFLGRQLAELMGGRLELEDTGPDGSCFRLAIPAIEDLAARS